MWIGPAYGCGFAFVRCNELVVPLMMQLPHRTNFSHPSLVRGRTTAPVGLVLGHEITGEVIELGRDVEFIKKVRSAI